MARGLPFLSLLLLLAACADEPPPPGTTIGAFSFVGVLDSGEDPEHPDVEPAPVPDPLADPAIACAPEGAVIPRCQFPGDPEDPLRFDAVLSYEPVSDGPTDFYLQPGNDSTREGEVDGSHFYTIAPRPVGCSNVGVPREVAGCESCRITAVEWIRGDLLEREPDGGCTGATVTPAGTFDPASVGAVCGSLLVRVTMENIDPVVPCECFEQDPRLPDEDLTQRPPADCAFVYTLTGTRS